MKHGFQACVFPAPYRLLGIFFMLAEMQKYD